MEKSTGDQVPTVWKMSRNRVRHEWCSMEETSLTIAV